MYAATAGKVGVVGYCFGGLVTAASAIKSASVFSAAASYYGGNTITLIDQKPAIPMIAHYGDKDQYIPVSDVDKIKAAWAGTQVYLYPADHGFNCDHRPAFDVQSAAIAQARTFRFFARHLG